MLQFCIHQQEYIGYIKVFCSGGHPELRPYFKCDLHKRCIPKISGNAAAVWEEKDESKFVKWCHTCPDRDLGPTPSIGQN